MQVTYPAVTSRPGREEFCYKCILIISLCAIFLLPAACVQAPAGKEMNSIRLLSEVKAPDGRSLSGQVSVAQWKASYERVADDIGRALKRLGWATLQVDAGKPNDQRSPPVRAEGLAPNGRAVNVWAWPAPDESAEQIVVAARVGHFGQADMESQFLRTLAKVLEDKPKRQYGGSFELPER